MTYSSNSKSLRITTDLLYTFRVYIIPLIQFITLMKTDTSDTIYNRIVNLSRLVNIKYNLVYV